MSFFEAFGSTLEILGGPADRAVHYHIEEAGATLAALQAMIGMSPEAYTAWVYGAEQPAPYPQGPEMTVAPGTSDLTAKHSELLATTQSDWAANQANVARDVVAAEATFGRLESAGGTPAIQAIPQSPIRQDARWN